MWRPIVSSSNSECGGSVFHIGFRGSLTLSVMKGLTGSSGGVAPSDKSNGGGVGRWLIHVTWPCVTQGSLSFKKACIG